MRCPLKLKQFVATAAVAGGLGLSAVGLAGLGVLTTDVGDTAWRGDMTKTSE